VRLPHKEHKIGESLRASDEKTTFLPIEMSLCAAKQSNLLFISVRVLNYSVTKVSLDFLKGILREQNGLQKPFCSLNPTTPRRRRGGMSFLKLKNL
jgi:hypothetical protein